MKAYLDIVRKILDTGERKENRTGIDAISIAGAMFEHDMALGFPMLTTKKVPFKIMAAELENLVKNELATAGKSLIIDMQHVQSMDAKLAVSLNELHALVYDSGKSFVICSIQPVVKKTLEEAGLLENLNTTPTDSEAWDIVQMEEIERELGMDF